MPVRFRTSLATATVGILLLSSCGGESSGGSAPTSTASATAVCAPPECIPVGPYTTTSFLEGQMSVVFAVPWQSGEDQEAEFSGAPPGTSELHRLLFWMDTLPTDTRGHVVTDVPHTAAGLLNWLSGRANLDVTAPRPATIGRAELPAHVVDISITKAAKSEDPGCPSKACALFLTWPDAGPNLYGIQEPNVVRLYLADVSYDVSHGGGKHLFAVAIEAKNHSELDAFDPTARKVIASMTGPIVPA